jgi:hypothetical protein
MAAPFIPSKQSFELTFGEYFSGSISHSGTSPFSWSAFGLPDGISINPSTGDITGTPLELGNRSSYILLTNAEGSFGGVITFSIKTSPEANLNFSISPDDGYAQSTVYQFSTNVNKTLSSYYLIWNFGDGSISNETNPKHIYSVPGEYNVSLFAYTSSTVISLSSNLNVNLLINESIYFDYVPPPTFANHYNRNPFKINFTSSKEGPHLIDLAAQFSRSYEHQNPRNKWSFLRPEWRFLDLNGNIITNIIPNETKLYCDNLGKINSDGNGLFVGVSGSAEFYFVDDIYNFDLAVKDVPYSTIIATLRTSAIRSFNDSFNASNELPSYSNSLATVSVPYMFLLRVPDDIKITENGIRDYVNPRWQKAQQPVIAAINYKNPYPEPFYWDDESNGIKIYNEESMFCHSFPLNGYISLNLGSTGISSNFVPYPTQLNWIDENSGYKSPGYYKGTFYTNTVSSLNAILTGSVVLPVPSLSSQFFNPILWLSNPEAGLMSTAQYIYNKSLSAVTTPNMNIAVVKNFEMPVINEVDFVKDPMALSGFHGIYSIAAMPFPDYHAWALDSELNYLYRLDTTGSILCAIDINKVVTDNQLGFLSPQQVSPVSIALDSNQNIWMTLYDTVSTLKFDRWGNFILATTPLSSTGYIFPPAPNIDPVWYTQNTYYDYEESSLYDQNRLNDIDLNFVEPTGLDTDTQDNVWVTYSYFTSGYLIKYNSNGGLIYSYAYPVCSCPQQVVVDANDNVWIALSNNIWPSKECTLEKRSSTGALLSSISFIRGLNYLAIDKEQNPWFTFSYSWIGSIDADTGNIFVTNLSGTGYTTNAANWFNPNINTDETALEGIACDLKGRVYIINSIENQIYVLDSYTKQFLNKFYINPQGFTFYVEDQSAPTVMSANLWNKSLQASGDWTGIRWTNKYANKLPYYSNSSYFLGLTGQSDYMNFIKHEDFDLFKFNEDFDMASSMQSLAFMPVLNESSYLFEEFLGKIYGKYPFKHDDLGVSVYEKIANFVANHSDVDYCNIDQLYDIANQLGVDSEDFKFKFPTLLKRLVDYASINQSRLFGSRSLQENYFNRANKNGILNRGNLITSLNYLVTAGTPLVLKDKSLDKYRLIQTGEIHNQSTYTLENLASSIGLNDVNWPSYYEFYEFNRGYDFNQLEGFIDWENPQTTLSENLSTSSFWLGPEGFLDKEFSYELYRGLGLI